MTILGSPYTIPGALKKGEEILGVNRIWEAQNAQQSKLLPFLTLGGKALSLKEIEAILSWDEKLINKFLRDRGFSIELEPLDDNEFGIGIVFKWMSKWLIKGESRQIIGADGIRYPGAHMANSKLVMYSHAASSNPAVAIPAKNGDRVYLSMLNQHPRDEFDVIEAAQLLLASQQWEGKPDLHFPMVDARTNGPIEWLLGMRTTTTAGQGAFISQAQRQSIFQLDPDGARAEDAAAVGIELESLSSEPTPVVIDQPFLAAIVRNGLALPLFTAYLTQESWKNPNPGKK